MSYNYSIEQTVPKRSSFVTLTSHFIIKNQLFINLETCFREKFKPFYSYVQLNALNRIYLRRLFSCLHNSL